MKKPTYEPEYGLTGLSLRQALDNEMKVPGMSATECCDGQVGCCYLCKRGLDSSSLIILPDEELFKIVPLDLDFYNVYIGDNLVFRYKLCFECFFLVSSMAKLLSLNKGILNEWAGNIQQMFDRSPTMTPDELTKMLNGDLDDRRS